MSFPPEHREVVPWLTEEFPKADSESARFCYHPAGPSHPQVNQAVLPAEFRPGSHTMPRSAASGWLRQKSPLPDSKVVQWRLREPGSSNSNDFRHPWSRSVPDHPGGFPRAEAIVSPESPIKSHSSPQCRRYPGPAVIRLTASSA